MLMILLWIISTLLMLISFYLNKKMTIMLNVTSCTTVKFNDLLVQLKDSKYLAKSTTIKFTKNYQNRKAILDEIEMIRKE